MQYFKVFKKIPNNIFSEFSVKQIYVVNWVLKTIKKIEFKHTDYTNYKFYRDSSLF